MRRLTLTALCFLLLLGASPVVAQSLGAVAKKERERREKNQLEGVPVREFTEEEVFGPPDDEATDEAEGEAPSEREPEPEPDGTSSSSATEAWERESRERRRAETEWRSRVHDARRRVEAARRRRATFDGLHLSVGEYYVDAHGRTMIQSLEHLQRLVREADDEVKAAEAALADLLDEARREGVPPGWLR